MKSGKMMGSPRPYFQDDGGELFSYSNELAKYMKERYAADPRINFTFFHKRRIRLGLYSNGILFVPVNNGVYIANKK